MPPKLLSPESTITPSEKQRLKDEIAKLPEVILTEKLDSSDLSELRRYFYPKEKNHGQLNYEMGFKKEEGCGIPLSKDQFADAVFRVIGNIEYEIAAKSLFDKLQEEEYLSENVIWWDDLLEVIVRGSAEAQLIGAHPNKRVKEKQNVLMCHCKSAIVRVLLVETPHSACYVVISKLGNVGIYDQFMKIKVKYVVPMGNYKTTDCSWVSDAVYANEANGIVIATSTRNLYFYNSSQIVHKLLFIILGIENIPLCMHYCAMANREAVLTLGDDNGAITTLRFHQPHKSFFQPQPDKDATTYFWQQLDNQTPWVDIAKEGKIHGGEVTMVEFVPENKSTVSSSTDPNTAVVMRHRDGKQSSYTFKVNKGVRRFRLDKRIGLLVTISGDYSIKLWNPVVTKSPIEELEGHISPIVDVAVLKHVRSIISVSDNAVLKVWDIENHSCVQTMYLNFPKGAAVRNTMLRNIYPGIRQVANADELLGKDLNMPTEADDSSQILKKDQWSRSEIIIVFGKYLKVLELESMYGQSVDPLPLPRKNLEPAIPTPYYPLTHTHRENTKTLKQKMFKNLAALAPFHESNSSSTFEFQQEYTEDINMMKMFVKKGVPHLALKICKLKPLSHSLFKTLETEKPLNQMGQLG